jgi:hypothetical protein
VAYPSIIATPASGWFAILLEIFLGNKFLSGVRMA